MKWRRGWLAVFLAVVVTIVFFLFSHKKSADREVVPSNVNPLLVGVDAPALMQKIKSAGAKAVVVNLWASWCDPCREEFPFLMLLRREYASKGVKVFFVSMDFDSQIDQVNKFLNEQNVNFETYMKTGNEVEFINRFLPQWSGALPVTAIFDGNGNLKTFWQGDASYAKFETEVSKVLSTKEKK